MNLTHLNSVALTRPTCIVSSGVPTLELRGQMRPPPASGRSHTNPIVVCPTWPGLPVPYYIDQNLPVLCRQVFRFSSYVDTPDTPAQPDSAVPCRCHRTRLLRQYCVYCRCSGSRATWVRSATSCWWRSSSSAASCSSSSTGPSSCCARRDSSTSRYQPRTLKCTHVLTYSSPDGH